ncbi:MAG TPA: FAD-dependent oxidoreductase [Candidatus Thermoplasmatota archaeon]|nr:FAD-dependent oxidoreductase [Candidatus Thermoplasmatota archaeon]
MPGAGASRSAWMDGVPLIPGDGPLTGDAQADICIIGAGVAGLTTAYLLAREGRSVIVLDDGPPGMGESLRTTAHLTAAMDDRIHVLAKKHGTRKARLVIDSTLAAIDRIERICREEHLDGIFRRVDGHLFLGPEDTRETLEKELKAAHEAGLADVRLDQSAPLPWSTGPCLTFPGQAEVDAGEYLSGLADAIRRMGGRIHAATHATDIEDGPPVLVRTSKGRVECEVAIDCTNAPVFAKIPLNTKQEQFRTYVLAYEVPRGWLPRALFWDTADPYHYVRLCDRAEPGKELLLIGGEDHRTGEGDPEDSLFRLEEWAKARFQLEAPAHRWSGQVIEPSDHLPFIGRYPGRGKNVYVITGDSGQGFTNHTIGAQLITDLIQGRRNPYQGLYSPNRQALTSLWARLRANTEGATEMVKGKLGKGEVADDHGIHAGSGAIVTRDGVKLACYREPSGELRECAAQCTHMGAIVQWNDLEKTWDCPWHGSRFTAKGQVVNGPANKALDPPDIPDKGAETDETDDMRMHAMPTTTPTKTSRAHGRTTRNRPARSTRARTLANAPSKTSAKPTGASKALKGRGQPDAIAMLKEDHRTVKGLLKRLDEADDGDERADLFEQVEQELLVHARLEEELFYPKFKQAIGDDDEDAKMYFEAHEEHEIAERVAAEIRAHDDPDADDYAAKCKVLKDLIEHHIEEEEGEMFPSARKAIGREELLMLAEDMRQRKQEMHAGDVDTLRRIEAPRDGIEPGAEQRDSGHGERADGSMWQRMRKRD